MKDILIRALKTFIQGFLGALAVTLPSADLSNEVLIKSILVGGLAAGISALMNSSLNLVNNTLSKVQEEDPEAK